MTEPEYQNVLFSVPPKGLPIMADIMSEALASGAIQGENIEEQAAHLANIMLTGSILYLVSIGVKEEDIKAISDASIQFAEACHGEEESND